MLKSVGGMHFNAKCIEGLTEAKLNVNFKKANLTMVLLDDPVIPNYEAKYPFLGSLLENGRYFNVL